MVDFTGKRRFVRIVVLKVETIVTKLHVPEANIKDANTRERSL
jgi:hypothetical protein